jgi:DNA-directed RNA polymerase specialized sigma24 family protein
VLLSRSIPERARASSRRKHPHDREFEGDSSTTPLELTEAAIALHNGLLHRALELTRNAADAEDLVQDVYVVFIAKPPEPRGATQLRRWLRTVMLRRHIDAQRRRRDQEPDVSLELVTDL